MRNKIQQIIKNIKKTNKKRTINLAILLTLLIALPFILKQPQEQQNLQQHAQVVPSGLTLLPIYGIYASTLDGMAPDWTEKHSYGGPTAVKLSNKIPTYCGSNSIAWTITSSSFEQLEFTYNQQAFPISTYNYLTFYVQAGASGQNIGALLIDANNNPVPSSGSVPINQYGGAPITNYWTAYNIPLTAFNYTGTIKGIAFKDRNGGTQNVQPPPPIYIDEINLSAQQASSIPCTVPGASLAPPPQNTNLEMPYYPEISPWVFIIPGIIIALAIIFQ